MEVKGKKILAKYIGEDGYLGFKTGHPYSLVVSSDNTVCTEDGKRKHQYANLKQFFDNWEFTHKGQLYRLPVHKYDKVTGDYLATYNTRTLAAQAHGVTIFAIGKAIHGKTRVCAGYRFSEKFIPNLFRI